MEIEHTLAKNIESTTKTQLGGVLLCYKVNALPQSPLMSARALGIVLDCSTLSKQCTGFAILLINYIKSIKRVVIKYIDISSHCAIIHYDMENSTKSRVFHVNVLTTS